MSFKEDDYVQLIDVEGNLRYGYIQKSNERGWHVLICMHDEGESKIEFDKLSAVISGMEPVDWEALLTDAEKRLIPLLAQRLSTKEIADQLEISPKTANGQIKTMRNKMQLDDRNQLVVIAQGLDRTWNERASRTDSIRKETTD